ncbi:MAG: radical SAM protein [Acidimicrobiia bacterium]|nr:radical SAM protein [Acidimicrobiia bacterium]
MGVDLSERVVLSNGFREGARYPAMFVNVTNRCTLSCAHCFVYRDDNPNEPAPARREIPDDELLEIIEGLRDRHGVQVMLWMGGEPLLRRRLVERGVRLFPHNTVVTNGTVPLVDLGADVLYVVSLDGPPGPNDAVRGAGTFDRVMRTLARLPTGFSSPVQVQCTVTRANQDHLGELVELLRDTPVGWVTFSFYVPPAADASGLGWATLEDRMVAVETVRELKQHHPGFVRNRGRALDLMAPGRAPVVTAACPAKATVLPLYLDGERLVTPFCCYGNDVDCSRCGAWVVFELAAGRDAGAPLG